MTGKHIHIRGLADEIEEAVDRITLTAIPEFERVLDAEDEDELRAAANALISVVLRESVRWTQTEIVAQLVEAGLNIQLAGGDR